MIDIIATRNWIMAQITAADTSAGDVFLLQSGIWTKIGNIASNKATGSGGIVWFNASGAPGAIVGQADGNYYYNTANGDVYQLESGTWTKIGNVWKNNAAGSGGTTWTQGSGAPRAIPGQTDGSYYLSTRSYLQKVAKYAGQVDMALMTGDIRPLEATLAPSVLVSYGDMETVQRISTKKVLAADHIWDMFAIGKSVSAHADDEAEEKAITIFQTILDPLFDGIHYAGTSHAPASMEFFLIKRPLVFTLPGTAVYHCQYGMLS
jgi:hypothetical protein